MTKQILDKNNLVIENWTFWSPPFFLFRYSIVAPKIFSDLKDDPKALANKALPVAGLDADDFRTGHTKVRVSQPDTLR